jgi:hypothetical protein
MTTVPFSLAGRVTGLGEFSPIGRLFTLGCFFENYKISLNYWVTFFHGETCALTLTTNGLGYTLGDFFKNLSGHPACRLCCLHKQASSIAKFLRLGHRNLKTFKISMVRGPFTRFACRYEVLQMLSILKT